MSPRKRSAGRQGWPDNLYPNKGGFKYRHPITRRETFMGRDQAKAFAAAKKLNAMLLPGNDLVDKGPRPCVSSKPMEPRGSCDPPPPTPAAEGE